MASLSQVEVIQRFINTHGDYYDYSKVDFVKLRQKVIIICPIHGEFQQRPEYHISGCGCQKCGEIKNTQRKNSYYTNASAFKEKANQVHNYKYDYSLVSKVNKCADKLTIICKEHGPFEQTANAHLYGFGCHSCGGSKRSTTSEFIIKAKSIHGERYDYTKVDYFNAVFPVIITCPVHGDFERPPIHHLTGLGCFACGRRFRKQEAWLNSLGVPNDQNHRQVRIKLFDNKVIIADGYSRQNNTVYEFWGDSWHGNPVTHAPNDIHPVTKFTYKELYDMTLAKIDRIVKSGFNLVQIWEKEWDDQLNI